MPSSDHLVALLLRRKTDFIKSNIDALLQAKPRIAKGN